MESVTPRRTTDAWRRTATQLIGRLRSDYRNGQILRDPWSRAAHYMVQGWCIRLSRPPAKAVSYTHLRAHET